MTTRSGAACRIEQQRKELPGEVSAVDVRVERVAVAAVRPPEAGLTQRVKTLCRLRPAQRTLTVIVIANHVQNVGALLWLNGLRRRDTHQHLVKL